MNKTAKKIEKYLSYFDQKTRNPDTKSQYPDTFYFLKDNSPKELKDAIRSAHGDRFPDDFIFKTFHDILESLSDHTIETTDDLQDKRQEIVDGLVSIYTSDLTEWLNKDNRNVYYIEEAISTFGSTDGFKILHNSQYLAIDEVYDHVATLLENKAK